MRKKQVTHKRCPPRTGCGDSFPATTKYFYQETGRTKTDGLSLYCKTCKNGKTREYNLKHPTRERFLRALVNKQPAPRYQSWIRLLLVRAQKKFTDPAEAAKWLGMRPGTFQVLLIKFKVGMQGYDSKRTK